MDEYMQLAQLMAPKMMGNAPMGAGAMAGLDFANQRNQQQTFLDKAAQMAELKAKMEAQKANDMAADAPLKAMERQKKMLEMTFASIGPYSNAWDAAKSPQEKQTILDEISNDPNVPEGFRQKIKGAPSDKVDSLFKMARNAQFNTPQYAQKTGVEEVKGNKRIEQAQVKADVDIFKAMLNATTQKELQASREAAQARLKQMGGTKEGKQTINNLIAEYSKKAAEETITPQESEVLKMLMQQQINVGTATAKMQGDVKAAQGAALNIPGAVAPRVPQAAQVPNKTAPAPATEKPKYVEGKIYVDANGNKAKYVNGKWEPVK